jgi:outer membrane protein assembly factor BamB
VRTWVTALETLDRAPSADEVVPDSVETVWTTDVGKSAADGLALGDSVVLATAADRRITLVRRNNGHVVWQRRLKGVGTAGPLFTLSRVYSASGDREGRLHAHDFWTGKNRWTTLVGPVIRPIALWESRVFAATATGDVYAVTTENGKVQWHRTFAKPIRSGVTVLGARVFVASEDSLFLLRADDGTTVHGVAARGVVVQPPAVAGDLLVLVSPEAFVAAYDANTLEERWWLRVGSAVFGGVAIARDTAFVATVDGNLWRVPLANSHGAIVQSLDRTIRMTPAPVRNGVLLGTVDGEVLFLRPDSDVPVWSKMVDGPLEFPPIVDDATIFVFDGRGTIHAWHAPSGETEPADSDGV